MNPYGTEIFGLKIKSLCPSQLIKMPVQACEQKAHASYSHEKDLGFHVFNGQSI